MKLFLFPNVVRTFCNLLLLLCLERNFIWEVHSEYLGYFIMNSLSNMRPFQEREYNKTINPHYRSRNFTFLKIKMQCFQYWISVQMWPYNTRVLYSSCLYSIVCLYKSEPVVAERSNPFERSPTVMTAVVGAICFIVGVFLAVILRKFLKWYRKDRGMYCRLYLE